MPTRIDPYSVATVPLQRMFGDTSLGNATGFVWQRHEKLYLITNWHVVSGRNADTGAPLSIYAGEPNALIALMRPKDNAIDTVTLRVPLKDEADKPLWLFHPVHKREVDVVAIPIANADGTWMARPINALPRNNELSIQVGMDVFVLGYPFGSAPPSLPVWKRGSIASEPQLVRLGDKFYLVDSASRPGMSGSPVILRSYGTHLTESGPSITTEPATRFLGIYSGRLIPDTDAPQICRVWPESFIIEVIDANTADDGSRD